MTATRIALWVLIAAATFIIGVVLTSFYTLTAQRTWTDTVLFVPQGQSRGTIARNIADQARLPLLPVQIATRFAPIKPLQAGEYDLTLRPSVLGLLNDMQRGKFIKRSITFAEGLTSYQILNVIKGSFGVTDDCPDYKSVPNGSLLPETYAYTRGETCTAILGRMKALMDKEAGILWAQRDPTLPYANWNEAVTMASIVEKETGVAAERPRVAGVFVNRLRLGMPMQSDPTTIYALTDGTGELGRPLTRADWKIQHPYNTYAIPALPPGPIAHPGLASLQAALHPERHDFLFFVANGTGGHAFAKTLDEHVQNTP